MAILSEKRRIRAQVLTTLKAANIPKIGQDIFAQRSIPTATEALPIALVYLKSESVERLDQSPKSYKRNMVLEIEVISKHDTDDLLSDEIDDLAQDIENALEGSDDLLNMVDSDDAGSALINDFNLVNSQYDFEGEGSSPVGSVKLSYDIEYYTNEDRAPEQDALERIGTQYKINNNTNDDTSDIAELDQ